MIIEIINAKTLKLLLAIVGLLAFASAPAAPKDFELHQAVLDNDLPLVGKFLSKGADIDLIGSRKYGYGSALHLAVREGHLDIARLLLERGAQVDVLDPDDFTPLHNAAWNGNLEMTQLLLEAGADVKASTYDGDTPLKLAQNNNQAQVAEFILAKLQPPATSETKVDTQAASDSTAIDITGTYVSEITSHGHSGGGPQQDKIVLLIEQHGNTITGTDSSGKADIRGTRTGDTIEIEFWAPFWSYGAYAEWKVNADGTQLEGSWKDKHTGYGKWNLTKIEADPIPDISGTYVMTNFSGSALVLEGFISRLKSKDIHEVTIVQNGNQITATYDDGKGKIWGKIEGYTVRIEWLVTTGVSGKGKWTIKPVENQIVGEITFDSGIGPGSSDGQPRYELKLTKIETPSATDSGDIDISGTYSVAELVYPGDVNKGYYRWYFGKGKDLKMTIEQSGEVVTGTFSGEAKGEFKGAIKGNEITFDYDSIAAGSSRYGSGVLMVSDDSTELAGTFSMKGTSSGTFTGNWKFRKTETEPAQAVDVTGTYMADLMGTNTGGQEGTAPWRKRKNSNREVKLLQKGKQVTGSFNGGKGSIFGEIDGNTIEFDWATGGGGNGKGKWTVKPDSKTLVGTWYCLVCTTARDGKWILTKIKSTPPSSLSGTYTSDLSGNGWQTLFWANKQGLPNPEVVIVHNGDQIIGTVDGSGRKLYGDIDGDTIQFEWANGFHTKGTWTFDPGSNRIVGTWYKNSGDVTHNGTWNLTRIE